MKTKKYLSSEHLNIIKYAIDVGYMIFYGWITLQVKYDENFRQVVR
jgi:hypothetical protein